MATHRRLWIILGAALLAVALLLVIVLRPRTQAALTAPEPGETLLAAQGGLDTVTIEATFNPVKNSLTVNQTMALVNRTGVTQRLLVLRAYPNTFRNEDVSPAATTELYDSCYPDGFSAGKLTVSALKLVLANGSEQTLSYDFGDDDAHTVLRISLPQDWAAADTLTVRVAYTVRIPLLSYRFGESSGIWALGNALVLPAPWVDGAYRTDEYESLGEPFLSECRNYTVRLQTPEGYTIAGTGAATQQVEDGNLVTTFSAPAVRDFALCLSTGYQTAQAMQDGVLVQAFALENADAKAMLQTAVSALACYTQRYGAYPYPVLSFCQVDLPFDIATYPGLAMIATDTIETGDDALIRVVARAAAKQWWAAVVGTDGYNQAWQSEAVSLFSLLDYWETRYGATSRADLQYSLVDSSMRVTVADGVTPGSPVDYFSDWDEYTLVAQERGAAALCALDTALNGGLDDFLSAYYRTCAFTLTSREDWETLLAAETGEDWSPLLSDYLDTYIDN